MRRVSLSIALLVAVVLVALALGTPSAQPAPQKVVFALNWFPVGDHAAYWVALEKGYYRQRGLDVDMQNSKGSGDSIAKVDTGRADVGLADSAVVIASSARGTKVKVVGMVFDKSPLNVWSRKDAPITKPKDLEGKTVGAPPGDGQRQMFPAFARLNGIEQNMMMGLELMKTDRYAKNGIGWMEEKKMCDSVDLVNTYMGVPTKVECKAVYTNEFLTKVELPKSAR